MKRSTTRIVLPLALASAVALVVTLTATSSAPACTQDAVAGVAGEGSTLATGRDPVAVVGSTLVTVDQEGDRLAYVHAEPLTGTLRHVTSRQGSGVAYVEDRAGPDAVTMVTPKEVATFTPGGEVTHPAWSEEGDLAYVVDLERVEVRSPGAPVRPMDRPAGSLAVFSPVFTGPGTLVALVQQEVPGASTHDDTLNNLWRLDLNTGSWLRLTSFTATPDRWTVLRTPVVDQAGRVLFVREQGLAVATEDPTYELWSLDASGPKKVRDLPDEMFLAGARGDGLLWNAFADGEWRLFLEGPEGMRSLGCGAVMVDPRTTTDPDHAGEEDDMEAAPPPEELLPIDAEMGLVIGDFATLAQAQQVAADLALVGGEVVDHARAPSAVMPGVYAVGVPLGDAADLEAALSDFRSRYPEYAEKTWLASLAG